MSLVVRCLRTEYVMLCYVFPVAPKHTVAKLAMLRSIFGGSAAPAPAEVQESGDVKGPDEPAGGGGDPPKPHDRPDGQRSAEAKKRRRSADAKKRKAKQRDLLQHTVAAPDEQEPGEERASDDAVGDEEREQWRQQEKALRGALRDKEALLKLERKRSRRSVATAEQRVRQQEKVKSKSAIRKRKEKKARAAAAAARREDQRERKGKRSQNAPLHSGTRKAKQLAESHRSGNSTGSHRSGKANSSTPA